MTHLLCRYAQSAYKSGLSRLTRHSHDTLFLRRLDLFLMAGIRLEVRSTQQRGAPKLAEVLRLPITLHLYVVFHMYVALRVFLHFQLVVAL